MSESPWNVNNRNRRAPQPLNPQSAQVKHVPRRPPAGPRPQARQVGASPQQRQHLPAEQPQQPEKGRARREEKQRRPKPPAALLILLAMVFVMAGVGAFTMLRSQERLQGLVNQREAAARRLREHKLGHLNARANSGYLALIEQYAKEYGISPSFVSAIIKCESSFNPRAVSRVEARGLMQIMPDTGVWLAGRLKATNYKPDALFDPETNIRFGTSYLAYLSDMFGGSPVMVASAYHAGANNVKHWALTNSADKKTILFDQIPTADTKDYVRKVMDAYAIYYEHDQGGSLPGAGAVPDDIQRHSAGS